VVSIISSEQEKGGGLVREQLEREKGGTERERITTKKKERKLIGNESWVIF
jgi:hypothetical protein